jgi:hypothetical protein
MTGCTGPFYKGLVQLFLFIQAQHRIFMHGDHECNRRAVSEADSNGYKAGS